jgi:anti-sigma factor RsiW
MSFKRKDWQNRIRRYLLSDLPEPDRESFERNYFADDDLFDEMVASEHELMDSYATGEMAKQEQALIERRMAISPACRGSALFSIALMRWLAKAAPETAAVAGGWRAAWRRGFIRALGSKC